MLSQLGSIYEEGPLLSNYDCRTNSILYQIEQLSVFNKLKKHDSDEKPKNDSFFLPLDILIEEVEENIFNIFIYDYGNFIVDRDLKEKVSSLINVYNENAKYENYNAAKTSRNNIIHEIGKILLKSRDHLYREVPNLDPTHQVPISIINEMELTNRIEALVETKLKEYMTESAKDLIFEPKPWDYKDHPNHIDLTFCYGVEPENRIDLIQPLNRLESALAKDPDNLPALLNDNIFPVFASTLSNKNLEKLRSVFKKENKIKDPFPFNLKRDSSIPELTPPTVSFIKSNHLLLHYNMTRFKAIINGINTYFFSDSDYYLNDDLNFVFKPFNFQYDSLKLGRSFINSDQINQFIKQMQPYNVRRLRSNLESTKLRANNELLNQGAYEQECYETNYEEVPLCRAKVNWKKRLNTIVNKIDELLLTNEEIVTLEEVKLNQDLITKFNNIKYHLKKEFVLKNYSDLESFSSTYISERFYKLDNPQDSKIFNTNNPLEYQWANINYSKNSELVMFYPQKHIFSIFEEHLNPPTDKTEKRFELQYIITLSNIKEIVATSLIPYRDIILSIPSINRLVSSLSRSSLGETSFKAVMLDFIEYFCCAINGESKSNNTITTFNNLVNEPILTPLDLLRHLDYNFTTQYKKKFKGKSIKQDADSTWQDIIDTLNYLDNNRPDYYIIYKQIIDLKLLYEDLSKISPKDYIEVYIKNNKSGKTLSLNSGTNLVLKASSDFRINDDKISSQSKLDTTTKKIPYFCGQMIDKLIKFAKNNNINLEPYFGSEIRWEVKQSNENEENNEKKEKEKIYYVHDPKILTSLMEVIFGSNYEWFKTELDVDNYNTLMDLLIYKTIKEDNRKLPDLNFRYNHFRKFTEDDIAIESIFSRLALMYEKSKEINYQSDYWTFNSNEIDLLSLRLLSIMTVEKAKSIFPFSLDKTLSLLGYHYCENKNTEPEINQLDSSYRIDDMLLDFEKSLTKENYHKLDGLEELVGKLTEIDLCIASNVAKEDKHDQIDPSIQRDPNFLPDSKKHLIMEEIFNIINKKIKGQLIGLLNDHMDKRKIVITRKDIDVTKRIYNITEEELEDLRAVACRLSCPDDIINDLSYDELDDNHINSLKIDIESRTLSTIYIPHKYLNVIHTLINKNKFISDGFLPNREAQVSSAYGINVTLTVHLDGLVYIKLVNTLSPSNKLELYFNNDYVIGKIGYKYNINAKEYLNYAISKFHIKFNYCFLRDNFPAYQCVVDFINNIETSNISYDKKMKIIANVETLNHMFCDHHSVVPIYNSQNDIIGFNIDLFENKSSKLPFLDTMLTILSNMSSEKIDLESFAFRGNLAYNSLSTDYLMVTSETLDYDRERNLVPSHFRDNRRPISGLKSDRDEEGKEKEKNRTKIKGDEMEPSNVNDNSDNLSNKTSSSEKPEKKPFLKKRINLEFYKKRQLENSDCVYIPTNFTKYSYKQFIHKAFVYDYLINKLNSKYGQFFSNEKQKEWFYNLTKLILREDFFSNIFDNKNFNIDQFYTQLRNGIGNVKDEVENLIDSELNRLIGEFIPLFNIINKDELHSTNFTNYNHKKKKRNDKIVKNFLEKEFQLEYAYEILENLNNLALFCQNILPNKNDKIEIIWNNIIVYLIRLIHLIKLKLSWEKVESTLTCQKILPLINVELFDLAEYNNYLLLETKSKIMNLYKSEKMRPLREYMLGLLNLDPVTTARLSGTHKLFYYSISDFNLGLKKYTNRTSKYRPIKQKDIRKMINITKRDIILDHIKNTKKLPHIKRNVNKPLSLWNRMINGFTTYRNNILNGLNIVPKCLNKLSNYSSIILGQFLSPQMKASAINTSEDKAGTKRVYSGHLNNSINGIHGLLASDNLNIYDLINNQHYNQYIDNRTFSLIPIYNFNIWINNLPRKLRIFSILDAMIYKKKPSEYRKAKNYDHHLFKDDKHAKNYFNQLKKKEVGAMSAKGFNNSVLDRKLTNMENRVHYNTDSREKFDIDFCLEHPKLSENYLHSEPDETIYVTFPELDYSQMLIRLWPKEKEQKDEYRSFAIGTILMKAFISATMLLCKNITKRINGQMMTMKPEERVEQLLKLSQYLRGDKMSLLADISGHNQSENISNMFLLMRQFEMIYGYNYPFLLSSTTVFSNGAMFFENKNTDYVYFSHGQTGSIEGWLGPFWTAQTCEILKICEEETNNMTLIRLLVYNDDMCVIVTLKGSSDEILKVHKNIFGSYNFILKPTQSVVSDKRVTMLKETRIWSVFVGNFIKKILSFGYGDSKFIFSDFSEIECLNSSYSSFFDKVCPSQLVTWLKYFKLIPLASQFFKTFWYNLCSCHDDLKISEFSEESSLLIKELYNSFISLNSKNEIQHEIETYVENDLYEEFSNCTGILSSNTIDFPLKKLKSLLNESNMNPKEDTHHNSNINQIDVNAICKILISIRSLANMISIIEKNLLRQTSSKNIYSVLMFTLFSLSERTLLILSQIVGTTINWLKKLDQMSKNYDLGLDLNQIKPYLPFTFKLFYYNLFEPITCPPEDVYSLANNFFNSSFLIKEWEDIKIKENLSMTKLSIKSHIKRYFNPNSYQTDKNWYDNIHNIHKNLKLLQALYIFVHLPYSLGGLGCIDLNNALVSGSSDSLLKKLTTISLIANLNENLGIGLRKYVSFKMLSSPERGYTNQLNIRSEDDGFIMEKKKVFKAYLNDTNYIRKYGLKIKNYELSPQDNYSFKVNQQITRIRNKSLNTFIKNSEVRNYLADANYFEEYDRATLRKISMLLPDENLREKNFLNDCTITSLKKNIYEKITNSSNVFSLVDNPCLLYLSLSKINQKTNFLPETVKFYNSYYTFDDFISEFSYLKSFKESDIINYFNSVNNKNSTKTMLLKMMHWNKILKIKINPEMLRKEMFHSSDPETINPETITSDGKEPNLRQKKTGNYSAASLFLDEYLTKLESIKNINDPLNSDDLEELSLVSEDLSFYNKFISYFNQKGLFHSFKNPIFENTGMSLVEETPEISNEITENISVWINPNYKYYNPTTPGQKKNPYRVLSNNYVDLSETPTIVSYFNTIYLLHFIPVRVRKCEANGRILPKWERDEYRSSLNHKENDQISKALLYISWHDKEEMNLNHMKHNQLSTQARINIVSSIISTYSNVNFTQLYKKTKGYLSGNWLHRGHNSASKVVTNNNTFIDILSSITVSNLINALSKDTDRNNNCNFDLVKCYIKSSKILDYNYFSEFKGKCPYRTTYYKKTSEASMLIKSISEKSYSCLDIPIRKSMINIKIPFDELLDPFDNNSNQDFLFTDRIDKYYNAKLALINRFKQDNVNSFSKINLNTVKEICYSFQIRNIGSIIQFLRNYFNGNYIDDLINDDLYDNIVTCLLEDKDVGRNLICNLILKLDKSSTIYQKLINSLKNNEGSLERNSLINKLSSEYNSINIDQIISDNLNYEIKSSQSLTELTPSFYFSVMSLIKIIIAIFLDINFEDYTINKYETITNIINVHANKENIIRRFSEISSNGIRINKYTLMNIFDAYYNIIDQMSLELDELLYLFKTIIISLNLQELNVNYSKIHKIPIKENIVLTEIELDDVYLQYLDKTQSLFEIFRVKHFEKKDYNILYSFVNLNRRIRNVVISSFNESFYDSYNDFNSYHLLSILLENGIILKNEEIIDLCAGKGEMAEIARKLGLNIKSVTRLDDFTKHLRSYLISEEDKYFDATKSKSIINYIDYDTFIFDISFSDSKTFHQALNLLLDNNKKVILRIDSLKIIYSLVDSGFFSKYDKLFITPKTDTTGYNLHSYLVLIPNYNKSILLKNSYYIKYLTQKYGVSPTNDFEIMNDEEKSKYKEIRDDIENYFSSNIEELSLDNIVNRLTTSSFSILNEDNISESLDTYINNYINNPNSTVKNLSNFGQRTSSEKFYNITELMSKNTNLIFSIITKNKNQPKTESYYLMSSIIAPLYIKCNGLTIDDLSSLTNRYSHLIDSIKIDNTFNIIDKISEELESFTYYLYKLRSSKIEYSKNQLLMEYIMYSSKQTNHSYNQIHLPIIINQIINNLSKNNIAIYEIKNLCLDPVILISNIINLGICDCDGKPVIMTNSEQEKQFNFTINRLVNLIIHNCLNTSINKKESSNINIDGNSHYPLTADPLIRKAKKIQDKENIQGKAELMEDYSEEINDDFLVDIFKSDSVSSLSNPIIEDIFKFRCYVTVLNGHILSQHEQYISRKLSPIEIKIKEIYYNDLPYTLVYINLNNINLITNQSAKMSAITEKTSSEILVCSRKKIISNSSKLNYVKDPQGEDITESLQNLIVENLDNIKEKIKEYVDSIENIDILIINIRMAVVHTEFTKKMCIIDISKISYYYIKPLIITILINGFIELFGNNYVFSLIDKSKKSNNNQDRDIFFVSSLTCQNLNEKHSERYMYAIYKEIFKPLLYDDFLISKNRKKYNVKNIPKSIDYLKDIRMALSLYNQEFKSILFIGDLWDNGIMKHDDLMEEFELVLNNDITLSGDLTQIIRILIFTLFNELEDKDNRVKVKNIYKKLLTSEFQFLKNVNYIFKYYHVLITLNRIILSQILSIYEIINTVTIYNRNQMSQDKLDINSLITFAQETNISSNEIPLIINLLIKNLSARMPLNKKKNFQDYLSENIQDKADLSWSLTHFMDALQNEKFGEITNEEYSLGDASQLQDSFLDEEGALNELDLIFNNEKTREHLESYGLDVDDELPEEYKELEMELDALAEKKKAEISVIQDMETLKPHSEFISVLTNIKDKINLLIQIFSGLVDGYSICFTLPDNQAQAQREIADPNDDEYRDIVDNTLNSIVTLVTENGENVTDLIATLENISTELINIINNDEKIEDAIRTRMNTNKIVSYILHLRSYYIGEIDTKELFIFAWKNLRITKLDNAINHLVSWLLFLTGIIKYKDPYQETYIMELRQQERLYPENTIESLLTDNQYLPNDIDTFYYLYDPVLDDLTIRNLFLLLPISCVSTNDLIEIEKKYEAIFFRADIDDPIMKKNITIVQNKIVDHLSRLYRMKIKDVDGLEHDPLILASSIIIIGYLVFSGSG